MLREERPALRGIRVGHHRRGQFLLQRLNQLLLLLRRIAELAPDLRELARQRVLIEGPNLPGLRGTDIASADPPSPLALVSRPRYHHQARPDRIEVEPEAFADDWIGALRGRGHAVAVSGRAWGNMQVVHIERGTGRVSTASDPRGRSGIAWF